MRPPWCVICDLSLRDIPDDADLDDHFTLVDFADYWVPEEPGWTGHPRGAVWFCAQHAPLAKERTELTSSEAVAEIEAILARDERNRSMAVTYEQAREIVRERFEPGWRHGTFCLDDRQIIETDDFYVFNIGAREYLVDQDSSYMIAGGVSIVFKKDGRVESRPSVAVATDPSIKIRPNPDPTLTV